MMGKRFIGKIFKRSTASAFIIAAGTTATACRLDARKSSLTAGQTLAVLNAPYDVNNTRPKSKRIVYKLGAKPSIGSGSWIAKNKFLTAGHVIAPIINQQVSYIVIGGGPDGTLGETAYDVSDFQAEVPDRYKVILPKMAAGGALERSDANNGLQAADLGILTFPRDMVGDADLVTLSLNGIEAGEKIGLAGYGAANSFDQNDAYSGKQQVGVDADGNPIYEDRYVAHGSRYVGTTTVSNIRSRDMGRSIEINVPEDLRAVKRDLGKALIGPGDSGSHVYLQSSGDVVGIAVSLDNDKGVIVNLAGMHADTQFWLYSHLPSFIPLGYDANNRPITKAKPATADVAELGDSAEESKKGGSSGSYRSGPLGSARR